MSDAPDRPWPLLKSVPADGTPDRSVLQPARPRPDDQTVTIGSGDRQMTTTAAAAPPAPVEEVEGVLEKFKPIMSAVIGLVSFGAITQAGWNFSNALSKFAHQPWYLAISLPLIIELGACTFALQDIWDRRKTGKVNREYRAATYAFLTASSLINGAVGYAMYKTTGLVEVIPPLIIGAMIHMHGNRATAAYHSQAITRPSWQAAHLKKAKEDSVLGVLPMLVGKTSTGQACIDLMKKRMESGTLTPEAALEAFFPGGWDDRHNRCLTKDQLQYLELVAATVWGNSFHGAPVRVTVTSVASPPRRVAPGRTPPPAIPATSPPLAASAPRRAAPLAGNSPDLAGQLAAGPARPGRTSPPAANGAANGQANGQAAASGRRLTEPELVTLVNEVRATRPTAGQPLIKEILDERGLSAPRSMIRAALRSSPPLSEGLDGDSGSGKDAG